MPTPDEERQRLTEALVAAERSGDALATADARAALGTFELLAGSETQAEWHYVQAVEACRAARRLDKAAAHSRALGQLRGSQGRVAEAVEAFTTSWGQAMMADAPLEALITAVRHADLLAKGGLHGQALATIDRALTVATEADLPGEVASLMQERSRHQLSLGQTDRALDTLQIALEASELTDDRVQQLRLRWALHQLERGLGRPPTADLAALRAEAAALGGVADVLWEIDLTEAALRHQQGDDLVRAAELARAARDGAFARRALPTYLQACLLLADIEDASGRRPAALLVLLTCHRNLANLLGDEAAAPVKAMMVRYRRQWGAEAYDQAFQALRDHVEAQRPPT